MPHGSHEAAFSEFVAGRRGLLYATAYLMFGGRDRAENVVQAALAQLFQSWSKASDPLPLALRQILYSQPGRLLLPWQRGERFELIDSSADRPLLPPGLVADLADLREDARRTIILERFVQFPSVQIATLMDTTVESVHELAREAKNQLALADSDRHRDEVLAEQLRAALPYEATTYDLAGAAQDLAHGRLLARRRTLRAALVATALLVVAVLGVSQLAPTLQPAQKAQPEHNEPRGPVPSRATSTTKPACDVMQPSCQSTVATAWRHRTARVASSYLDPDHRYFSGYTYSLDDRYDSPTFWKGQGGVLGLDLFRLNESTTEVYLQMATSDRFAVPCGQETHQRCVAMTFMDSNTFALSDSTMVSEGLEAQYSPLGDEVITVVVRKTGKGKGLTITRAQLVSLVQDPRLRLPVI